MSTQDDDELKLEPPRAQPPAPQPAPSTPAEAVPSQPPAPRPADDLQPGAGKPLVEGPPMSVSEPISESTINRTAAFAGIGILGIGLVVAVLLVVLLVLALCVHR